MSTPAKKSGQGIILVLAQSEPEVSTSEFDEWHNKQNTAVLSAASEIQTVTRYKETDGQTPQWLTTYDIASTEPASSVEYAHLRDALEGNRDTIVPQLPILQHRAYTLLIERENPSASPAKCLLFAGWLVPPELDEEFNRWYDEEHIGDISKLPEWVRTRRYKLVESQDVVPRPGPQAYPYLILFEWEDDRYLNGLGSDLTPWTKKMMAAGKYQMRTYEIY